MAGLQGTAETGEKDECDDGAGECALGMSISIYKCVEESVWIAYPTLI